VCNCEKHDGQHDLCLDTLESCHINCTCAYCSKGKNHWHSVGFNMNRMSDILLVDNSKEDRHRLKVYYCTLCGHRATM
jgi:hypothetical protein